MHMIFIDLGALDRHPLVQGILVAAVEQARRAQHNVHNMKGLKLSDLEMTKMSEAGVAISMAGNNMHLMQQFGLAFTVPRLPLSNLHAHNLPEPFLAMTQPGILDTNAALIASALRCKGRPTTTNPRRFALAFDKTCLLKGIDVVSLRRGKGFVGTSYQTVEAIPNADVAGSDGWLPLEISEPKEFQGGIEDHEEERSWDATTLDYAKEMCEFLLWDPTLDKNPRFSLCCIPTAYSSTSMDMLKLVGMVLSQAGRYVRTITFDNASNHRHIKAFLLGERHGLSEQELLHLPFWSQIQYVPFPASALPRFPYRRPMYGNEALLPD